MATEFNNIFSAYEQRQVVEWGVNQYFEDNLCASHLGNDDEDRDGPRNVGLLAIQPSDEAT